MSELIEKARAVDALKQQRDDLRQKVLDWMRAEGLEGRFRFNNQAPMWADYLASEAAVVAAFAELGRLR